jgi:cytochrome c-type biogenesis protein
VPLCRRGRTARALALALSFGAGLTITLTLWGVVVAGAGGFFGLRELARYLSLAGGGVAYVLGLWTLGLVRFPLPAGNAQVPAWVRERSEYLGAFLLGLLLGNMGLCCPDPVFLSLIPFIAARSDAAGGALLAAAYGLGRATPLVAAVVLARSGVDALRIAARHKQTFDRVLGWGLVAAGTLILYGYSGVSHGGLLAVLLMIGPVLAYHVINRSPWPRASAWLVATVFATIIGLRLVYLLLLHLP